MKSYQVYALPTCEHCHRAVELMKQKQVLFEQIDASSSEGVSRFRIFYREHKDEIKRDDKGTVNLPVVVYQNNGTLRIHQGTDGLERFLETDK